MYFFMFVEWLIFCGLVRFSIDCLKSRSLIGPQIVWVNPWKLILKIFLSISRDDVSPGIFHMGI